MTREKGKRQKSDLAQMLTEFITDPDGADQDHDPGGTDSDQDHLAKENAKARQGQCAHICSSHFAVSLQIVSLHNFPTLVAIIVALDTQCVT